MTQSLLYSGSVRHRRYTIKAHEFSYRLFMFYFDLSAIDETFKPLAFVSVEKFNWFSYQRKNYLGSPALLLDRAVRELVNEKKGYMPKGKIYLLTHLSCFNYCFNPMSLYFVFKENSKELEVLIIEVTNTPWGEKHNYVLDNPEKPRPDIYNYTFEKALHVSPFMTMDYTYQFNLKLSDNRIIVHMRNLKAGLLHFDATLNLKNATVEKLTPLKVFLSHPLMTFKVIAAIHYQALKLWIKRVPYQPHHKIEE